MGRERWELQLLLKFVAEGTVEIQYKTFDCVRHVQILDIWYIWYMTIYFAYWSWVSTHVFFRQATVACSKQSLTQVLISYMST